MAGTKPIEAMRRLRRAARRDRIRSLQVKAVVAPVAEPKPPITKLGKTSPAK